MPRSFLGVSTDWTGVFFFLSAFEPGPNPVYDKLISNLSAYGGGTPSLRIGGGAQDHSWWNPTGKPRPLKLGVQHDITPYLLQTITQSIAATGQRLILGVNMGAGSIPLAVNEVRAMQQYIPQHSVMAYDIGNEPEGYGVRGLYTTTANGRTVVHTMRPARTWNQGAYIRDFRRYAKAIERLHPRPPLSADSAYGITIKAAPFLRADHRYLKMYTQHAYIGTACNPTGKPWPPGSPHTPTVRKLLSPAGKFTTLSEDLAGGAAASKYHLPFQITEWQTYACGGLDGVSNSFAAALWGLDEMFLDAAIGVSGINIHMDSYAYSPIWTYPLQNGQRVALVGALYYAMLMFAEATAHDARIVVGPTRKAKIPRGANVSLWATRDSSKTLRFVVIDKSLHRSGTVRISIAHAHGPATIVRLTAAHARTRYPIFVGGQTFARPTSTGVLTGTPTHETVRPHHGVYSFTISKVSAAMLVVPSSSY